MNAGQARYSGQLYGDAFRDAEVFVINSLNQATMLHTFDTPYSRNLGAFELIGNNNKDMGSFSFQCALE